MISGSNVASMGAFKAVKKFLFLSVLLSVIASVVATMKQNKSSAPTSYEEWPDVPQNPEA
jgi:hypothetical protein